MLRLLEDIPVELVGTNVLGYLSLKDIVMLERACGSKKSYKAFMEQITGSPPVTVTLPSFMDKNISIYNWFARRHCKIYALDIKLPGDNPCLHVKKLQVKNFHLQIYANVAIDSLKPLLENNVGCKVTSVCIIGDQNREVIKYLCACTVLGMLNN